jgi:hypothetical protein
MLRENENKRFIITHPNQLDDTMDNIEELKNIINGFGTDDNYRVHFALTYMTLPNLIVGISIVPLHFSGGIQIYGDGIADQIKKLQTSRDKMFANYILGYYRYYIGYEKILSESIIWKIYKAVGGETSKRRKIAGIIRYIDLISQ